MITSILDLMILIYTLLAMVYFLVAMHNDRKKGKKGRAKDGMVLTIVHSIFWIFAIKLGTILGWVFKWINKVLTFDITSVFRSGKK